MAGRRAKDGRSVWWPPVMERAKQIAEGDGAMMAKDLYARLLGEGILTDSTSRFNRFCELVRKGNQEGTFPVLRSKRNDGRPQIRWADVLERAKAIVDEYDTDVTLRQLFYRLVAEHVLPNSDGDYRSLAHRTAEARRDGLFPDLLDTTRSIEQPASWSSPEDILGATVAQYQRDHTEGQEWSIYLGVEKMTMVGQLTSWFDEKGLPVLPLRGYASHAFKQQVRHHILALDRPAVLLYAGDFDASGEDIQRDFVERVGFFDEVHRIAVTLEQVDQYELPPAMGKQGDSRRDAFIAEHGADIQVELEAMPPTIIHQLFEEMVGDYYDDDVLDEVLEREEEERDRLRRARLPKK